MCLLLCSVFLNEREERFPALAMLIWTALPKFGADSKADQMEDIKLPLLSLLGLRYPPKAEVTQKKPCPGALRTQTLALLLLNEAH